MSLFIKCEQYVNINWRSFLRKMKPMWQVEYILNSFRWAFNDVNTTVIKPTANFRCFTQPLQYNSPNYNRPWHEFVLQSLRTRNVTKAASGEGEKRLTFLHIGEVEQTEATARCLRSRWCTLFVSKGEKKSKTIPVSSRGRLQGSETAHRWRLGCYPYAPVALYFP
jgi:hypothetical protein